MPNFKQNGEIPCIVKSLLTSNKHPFENGETLSPYSGQEVRLRGGLGPWQGYLEFRGSSEDNWNHVCCHCNSWSRAESLVVCQQLGFSRGADKWWQKYSDTSTINTSREIINQISCSGSEQQLSSCDISYRKTCEKTKITIGIQCQKDAPSVCSSEETPFSGSCYSIHKNKVNYESALKACKIDGGNLLEVNSQLENDFISEWLIQEHSSVATIWTGGFGVSVFHRSRWYWESDDSLITFTKWWPGWTNDEPIIPQPSVQPLCIIIQIEFPHETKSIRTDYFFWSAINCTMAYPYICEKPYNALEQMQPKESSEVGCEFHCSTGDCILNVAVCDGDWDCPNGEDERHCTGFLSEFLKLSSKRLEKHKREKHINVLVETCAQLCVESNIFICRSFNYNAKKRVCVLSDSNVGLSGALVNRKDWNYYELSSFSLDCSNMFVCQSGKCVNVSVVCDGRNHCGDRSDEKDCAYKDLGYELRLVDGNTTAEGRVEIKVRGSWGIICDDLFALKEADVICHELGFSLGALRATSDSEFGSGNGNFLVDDLQCLGNETTILECNFKEWGNHDCHPLEVAGVVCRIPGATCSDGQWQCNNSDCIQIGQLCNGNNDCEDGSDELPEQCEAPLTIRLADGSNKMEGRVELRYHNIWGTVCDDNFDLADAKVICRMQGYDGPVKIIDGKPGSGQIWLDEMHCDGTEKTIEECKVPAWGVHNCKHEEDVSIRCTRMHIEPFPNTLRIFSFAPVSLPRTCGMRIVRDDIPVNRDAKVIGGIIARKGQYPWQASIRVRTRRKTVHHCGAVVVTQFHLLTAQHCLQKYDKAAYVIHVGDFNTEEIEDTEQIFRIDEIYSHEDYNKDTYFNDIALIKIRNQDGQGIEFNQNVQPACLPSSATRYDSMLNCTISGWGSTDEIAEVYSHLLMFAWISLFPEEICRKPDVYGSLIMPGMFCAGSLHGGQDSCRGDSGGPLMCLVNGRFTLYGITSWGHGCGRMKKPGVYTCVGCYRNWIDEKIAESLTT